MLSGWYGSSFGTRGVLFGGFLPSKGEKKLSQLQNLLRQAARHCYTGSYALYQVIPSVKCHVMCVHHAGHASFCFLSRWTCPVSQLRKAETTRAFAFGHLWPILGYIKSILFCTAVIPWNPYKASAGTLVLYEAPHRLLRLGFLLCSSPGICGCTLPPKHRCCKA